MARGYDAPLGALRVPDRMMQGHLALPGLGCAAVNPGPSAHAVALFWLGSARDLLALVLRMSSSACQY